MEALRPRCGEGTAPPEDYIQQLCALVPQAEPEVQPYLRECVRSFAAGAYGVAIVACWCAIARYLRLVVESIGVEMGQLLYKDEESRKQPFQELIKRGDKPLLVVYQRMKLVEDHLERKAKGLDDLYAIRCDYAYPTGREATCQEAFDYVTQARWLLTRKVERERFQEIGGVLQYAKAQHVRVIRDRAQDLIFRVADNKLESLAISIQSELLAESPSIPYESAVALWKEAGSRISQDVRRRLMIRLAKVLSPPRMSQTGQVSTEQDVARDLVSWEEEVSQKVLVSAEDVGRDLVFWEDVPVDAEAIWKYLVDRRIELNERVKSLIRSHAPAPYNEQIDEPT